MKVQCFDDTGRPNEIPLNKWVKKGETYTVIGSIKCNIQGGALALILAEIDLSDCEPYKGFAANRFCPPEKKPVIKENEMLDVMTVG